MRIAELAPPPWPTGLPTDVIASKLCDLVEKDAAAAGGLSGATASAAVLTAGVGLPGAITGVMAEVLSTQRSTTGFSR